MEKQLDYRKLNLNYRILKENKNDLIDFHSNDFLGLARDESLWEEKNKFLKNKIFSKYKIFNGSTGSRLLSGNLYLHSFLENYLSKYYENDVLLFNSGCFANIGLLSSIANHRDVFLYDIDCHSCSIQGIKLSNAKSYPFRHNDLKHLENRLKFIKNIYKNLYVIIESIYSMDGSEANIKEISKICEYYKAYLIVDEAHSTGIYKKGMISHLNLNNKVFAKILTFGKACGSFGAIVVGSKILKKYLLNFAKTFIYSTALPPDILASIYLAHKRLEGDLQLKLFNIKNYFISKLKEYKFSNYIPSNTHIQILKIGDNKKLNEYDLNLKKFKIKVSIIKSPAVKKGEERIRICLHSFNLKKEIDHLLNSIYKLTLTYEKL